MFRHAMNRIEFGDGEEYRKLLSIVERLVWKDLYKVIKDEPIVVKGAFDFSLKSLVGALHKGGKIDLTYDECKITSGMSSLMAAIVADASDIPFNRHELIADVITYNEVDCKSLYKILTYLRENH